MNFNFFSQISKIVGRQINNISKKITRLLKLASKPMVYLNTYVRSQVKAMTRPPASKADYVRFGSIYLSKRFLGLSVMGIVAICTVFTAFVYPWMEGRLWTPTMTLNSNKMAGYTGKAKIENQVGQLIYQGDVEQGQLTGTVTEVTFKGMHYDIIVDFKGFKWLIQTTDFSPVGARIGVKIDPDGFHIMKKSRYSGMFGDYSSYSSEYDELNEGPEEGIEDEE